jgi:hypothetical protein
VAQIAQIDTQREALRQQSIGGLISAQEIPSAIALREAQARRSNELLVDDIEATRAQAAVNRATVERSRRLLPFEEAEAQARTGQIGAQTAFTQAQTAETNALIQPRINAINAQVAVNSAQANEINTLVNAKLNAIITNTSLTQEQAVRLAALTPEEIQQLRVSNRYTEEQIARLQQLLPAEAARTWADARQANINAYRTERLLPGEEASQTADARLRNAQAYRLEQLVGPEKEAAIVDIELRRQQGRLTDAQATREIATLGYTLETSQILRDKARLEMQQFGVYNIGGQDIAVKGSDLLDAEARAAAAGVQRQRLERQYAADREKQLKVASDSEEFIKRYPTVEEVQVKIDDFNRTSDKPYVYYNSPRRKRALGIPLLGTQTNDAKKVQLPKGKDSPKTAQEVYQRAARMNITVEEYLEDVLFYGREVPVE